MTKFDDLVAIITHNKNKDKPSAEVDSLLEVAGSECSKTPLLSCGNEKMDGSIIYDLYRKAKHKPLEGQFAQKWDSDQ
jgi:hypothetical protein